MRLSLLEGLLYAIPPLLVMIIGTVSAALTALVTAPMAICSSIALSTDFGLLADAIGTSSKEASTASSSFIDAASSSVLASATASFSPEDASEVVALSSELTSTATASSSETAFAASISISSPPTPSATAPEDSVLSLEDDELSKFFYTRKKKKV